MTQDPADRLVDPGPRVPADVGRADVPEADVIEQAQRVDGDADADPYAQPLPLDANPDDVAEQRLEVPLDEDEYPGG